MSKEPRYKAVEGSAGGHGCCFDATVVDTSKPTSFYAAGAFETMCECSGLDEGNVIAEALNLRDRLLAFDATVIKQLVVPAQHASPKAYSECMP